jgi:hypothetical protein
MACTNCGRETCPTLAHGNTVAEEQEATIACERAAHARTRAELAAARASSPPAWRKEPPTVEEVAGGAHWWWLKRRAGLEVIKAWTYESFQYPDTRHVNTDEGDPEMLDGEWSPCLPPGASPPSPGLVEAARLAMPFVEAAAEEQQSYGYFLSGLVNGDPRAFSPDPECATPEELAQHKADCEAWDRCERPVHVTMQTIDPERSIARQLKGANSAMLIRDGDGNVTGGHVHRAGYGLGVTVFRDADAVTALDALCAALPKEPAGR